MFGFQFRFLVVVFFKHKVSGRVVPKSVARKCIHLCALPTSQMFLGEWAML